MLRNLGPMELIIILLIVLLLFGGRKIPEIAKGLGKGIRDFKDAMNSNGSEDKSLKKPENPGDEKPKA
jgi:sec-independent protein translocase protein TatA